MVRIQSILCPLDFSEFSLIAYDYAQSLARHYDAKLSVQHVVQPLTSSYPNYPVPDFYNNARHDLLGEAEQKLREFLKEHTHNGTQPESVVNEGEVMDSILALANQKNVDLIVMGTHGRSGLDRFLLGSTTEKILRKARCPVLVVRKPVNRFVKPEDRRDPVHPRKILSCTDFSKHSEMALKYALSLATEFSAELTLLHVLEDVPRSPEVQSVAAEVLRDLEALVPREAIDWCTIRPVIRIGKPYQEIIQLALEARSDLIVLGVRGRSALDLALFGSTTHRVIQLGTCPVLAVQI